MTLPEVESRVGLTRGSAGAISQPMAQQSPLQAFAGVTKDLADASFEIVKQRQSAAMMRELSDMKLRQDARMKELSETSEPGASVVEAGMDMFVKEANDFIDKQPSYLRDAAREKMFMLRDSTASNLLALEAKLSSEKIALDTQAFANNLLNDVRYGTLDEASALALAEEYGVVLPKRISGSVVKEMQDGVRVMALSRMAEDDPEKALSTLSSGKYNSLDPEKLAQIEGQAQRTIEKRKREALAKKQDSIEFQNKILKARLDGDYVGAASLTLMSQGVDDPSNDQLIKAQRELGALETQISLLPGEEAKFYGDRLAATRSKEEFAAEASAILQQFPNEDERNIVLRDIKKHSDLGGLLDVQIDAAFVDNGPYGTLMQNAAFKVMIEPDTFESATKSLDRAAKDDKGLREALDEVQSHLSKAQRGMILSDVNPIKAQEFVDTKQKMAFVAINDYMALGRKVNVDTVKRMFDELGTQSSKFYPLNIRKEVADSITEAGIERAKKGIFDLKDNILVGYGEDGSPITKKDNPLLYDTLVNTFADEIHLLNAGTLPSGENAFFVKGPLGADFLYEVDENGIEQKVVLTERELVEFSRGAIAKTMKSIKEGF